MDCIGYQAKCCCGPYPCSLGCNDCYESISTRIFYSAILLVFAVLSCLTHVQQFSLDLDMDDAFNRTCIYIRAGPHCQRLTGYLGVYRLGYTLTVFHLFMCLLTIGVKNSRGWRGRIHNGFWLIKIFVLLGLWVGAYFIPSSEILHKVAMYVGLVGGFLFITITHMYLIDYSYELNGKWKAKSVKNCCYGFLIYAITIFLFVATGVAYAMIYLFYASPEQCHFNKIVLFLNISVSFVLVVIALLPLKRTRNCFIHNQLEMSNELEMKAKKKAKGKVKAKKEQDPERLEDLPTVAAAEDVTYSIVLPSAVASAFVAFLTWTALSSEPSYLLRNGTDIRSEDLDRITVMGNDTYFFCRKQSPMMSNHLMRDFHSFVGVAIIVISAIYQSIRTSMQEHRVGLRPSNKTEKKGEFGGSRHGSYLNVRSISMTNLSASQQSLGAAGGRPKRLQARTRSQSCSTGDVQVKGSLPNLSGVVMETGKAPRYDKKQKRGMGQKDAQVSMPFLPLRVQELQKQEMGGRKRHQSTPKGADVILTGAGPGPSTLNKKFMSQPDMRIGHYSEPGKANLFTQKEKGVETRKDIKKKDGKGPPQKDREVDIQEDVIPEDMMDNVSIQIIYEKEMLAFAIRDEWSDASYTYSWFHFVFSLASLFIMVQLTNWYNPEQSEGQLTGETWTTVYIKLITSWLAMALFGWTLFCPIFCINRPLLAIHDHTLVRNKEEKRRKKSTLIDTVIEESEEAIPLTSLEPPVADTPKGGKKGKSKAANKGDLREVKSSSNVKKKGAQNSTPSTSTAAPDPSETPKGGKMTTPSGERCQDTSSLTTPVALNGKSTRKGDKKGAKAVKKR